MKTVMIIPAGVYQLPAIVKAKEMGFRVITADNKPDNPGHKLADFSANISILNQDELLELAKKENIDAVFTMSSDLAVKAVGYIARMMGLVEGLPDDNIDTICNKHMFRYFQEQNGFIHPPFAAVTTYEQLLENIRRIGLPAILKPSDSSGSRGVFFLDGGCARDQDYLREIYYSSRSHSRNGILCLEQFVNGLEVGGDALVVDGKVIFCEITNKYLTPAPHFVPIGHSIPSMLEDVVKTKLKNTIQGYARLLGIENSMINFDVMVLDKELIVLEISPRIGGNCIPQIIKYGTGFDPVEAALLLSLGVKPRINNIASVKPVGVRILRSNQDGYLKSHNSLKDIRKKYDILELLLDVSVGSRVSRFAEGSRRLGHVICTANSIAELEAMLDAVEQELNIQVESVAM